MILLTKADFSGFHLLAKSIAGNPILDDYILRYEESYIKKIFGVELGQIIIDSLPEGSGSEEIPQRILDAINPFILQPIQKIWESKGLVDILASLVYYHFICDTQPKHGQSGVVINQVEVGDIQGYQNAVRFAEKKWNNCLESIEAIQWYCGQEKKSNYPEYKGRRFDPNYTSMI